MSAWSSSSNLGDALFHLHFLMSMGGSHQMYCKPEYISDLSELADGFPVSFHHVDERPPNSIDWWMANGAMESRGVHFFNQVDIMGFLMQWFNAWGGFCGMPRPVYERRIDMLWSCPSIPNANVRNVSPDVLFLNCPPTSGQCPAYDHGEVCRLGEDLRSNGLYVLFAQWDGICPYSITELAKLSMGAKLIIQGASGPSWPCWNVWNQGCDRITLLSPMVLNYEVPGRCQHAANAQEARMHCENMGYL